MSPDARNLDAALYAHLRALAGRIRAGAGDALLDPTELVHEAWLKMRGADAPFADRRHFLRTAAVAMRQVLVDRARARATAKRDVGGSWTTLPDVAGVGPTVVDLLGVDAALSALEAMDPRAAEVALLRTFGGLTVPEVAELLDVSPRTVNTTWRFARAFLEDHLGA